MTTNKHEWLENAIFYEIYPQSFNDSNGDGIGDLQGIINKLPYIKELGCNALWINPCFESPFNDAGYDISDYYKIAPRYGTNEDARRLFKRAHELGIKVLFDLVPGHTSVEHEWFKKSKELVENEYSGRYIWADNPWEHFTGVSNITGFINGVSDRGSCAVNFYTTQPALNYGFVNPDPNKKWQSSIESPEARASKLAMMDIMDFWLSMGCDGFRIDMAHSMIKNDTDSKETIKFWQEVRKFLDERYLDAVIISEWGEPDKSIAAGFHMDFLLHFGPSHYVDLFRENPFFAGKGDLVDFLKYYRAVLDKAGKDGLICIPSSNHDMPRISQNLSVNELKLAFAFLLSVPGAPFIYYGDEIGMRYMSELLSHEGGYERTGSRTPMQWDKTLNAGFSSAKKNELYLPIDQSEERPDVMSQENDENSLLNEVKKLTKLRLSEPILQNYTDIEFLTDGSMNKPLIYLRKSNLGEIFIGINPYKTPISTGFTAKNGEMIYNINGKPKFMDNDTILEPESAVFISFKKN